MHSFLLHCEQVNSHIKALRTLCKRKASITEKGDSLVERCANQLLAKALSIVDSYIKEMKQPCQNSFQTPLCRNMRMSGGKKMGKSLSLVVTAVFTIGSLLLVCPTADTKGIVPVLHTIITSGSSEQKFKIVSGAVVSIKQVAPSLYIQSWLTMGKICLVDGKIAKRYIPLFVQVILSIEV